MFTAAIPPEVELRALALALVVESLAPVLGHVSIRL